MRRRSCKDSILATETKEFGQRSLKQKPEVLNK